MINHKSKQRAAGPASTRELIGECLTDAEWRALIRKQVELALDGNKAALELILEYYFGRPVQMEAPGAEDRTPISFINIRPPSRSLVERMMEDGRISQEAGQLLLARIDDDLELKRE